MQRRAWEVAAAAGVGRTRREKGAGLRRELRGRAGQRGAEPRRAGEGRGRAGAAGPRSLRVLASRGFLRVFSSGPASAQPDQDWDPAHLLIIVTNAESPVREATRGRAHA